MNKLTTNRKILRIVTRLNVGGPTKHVAWLSSGLSSLGWDGLLVAGNVEDDEDDMDSFVAEFGINYFKLNTIKRSIDIRNDLRAIIDIYKLLCNIRPSILHTHMSKAGLVGRIALIFYNLLHKEKIKAIHTFHGHTFHGYFSPIKEKFFLFIERFLARFATNAIITISPQQQSEILKSYKVGSADQHYQINLGIDTSFAKDLDLETLRRELNIKAETKVFGIVGRIAEIKNHELFIDSAREFLLHHPQLDIKFVIIGGGEQGYVNSLKLYAQDLSQVVFAGNRADPRQFYGLIDYLVLTSKNEGTPVSILEAFACRIPVVSTNVGGVVDLIGADERGMVVESSYIELANAYDQMLREDFSVKVGNAEEFVAKNYSIDGLIQKINNLYLSLLEGKK